MMNTKVDVTEDKLRTVAQEAYSDGKLEKLADGLMDEIIKVVLDKNHDYGDAWQRFGIFTPLVRLNDKLLRIKTLLLGQQALVADEKIVDTLRDTIGYSLLALIYVKEHPEVLDGTDAAE